MKFLKEFLLPLKPVADMLGECRMPMKFIAVLLCLLLQRFLNIQNISNDKWFDAYLRVIEKWIAKIDPHLIFISVIIPVWLGFLGLHLVLRNWNLYEVLILGITTVVLFFSIDARDLRVRLKPYFVALSESDMQGAADAVSSFIDISFINNLAELEKGVSRAILFSSFEKIFAGLFWFLALGIYGVSTYTITVLLAQRASKLNPSNIELAKLASKLQGIFEWLPARLVGFSFALVGRFSRSASYSLNNLWSGVASARDFVVGSGLAALDIEPDEDFPAEENYAALDLINRTIIVWLIAISFMLIGFIVV